MVMVLVANKNQVDYFKKSAKRCFAFFQFPWSMQYLTLGGSILPQISPDCFNTFKC